MLAVFVDFLIVFAQIIVMTILLVAFSIVLFFGGLCLVAIIAHCLGLLPEPAGPKWPQHIKIKGGRLRVFEDGQVIFLRDDGWLWRARWGRDPDQGTHP